MDIFEQEKLAEECAKKWMLGKRKNSERESWRHPEDVVKLVDELNIDRRIPGGSDAFRLELKTEMRTVAWLHDILEDGKIVSKLDPVKMGIKEIIPVNQVTVRDLRECGFNNRVISAVLLLTRDKKESKRQYLNIIRHCERREVQEIKILDRIANLREGKKTMSEEWFKDYSLETLMYFPHIVHEVGGISSKIGDMLMDAMK